MDSEVEITAAVAVRPRVPETANAVELDVSDVTPLCQIFQPTAPAPALSAGEDTTAESLPFPKRPTESRAVVEFEAPGYPSTRVVDSSISEPLKSTTYEAKLTNPTPRDSGVEKGTPEKGLSRQRRRTLKDAVAILDAEIPIMSERRMKAVQRVRRSRRPVTEAKRIVAAYRREGAPEIEAGSLDQSDVQEIRVRLLRRDGGLWPPQSTILHRMERGVALGTMSVPKFKAMAVMVLNMPQAFSEKFRIAEKRFAWAGEWV